MTKNNIDLYVLERRIKNRLERTECNPSSIAQLDVSETGLCDDSALVTKAYISCDKSKSAEKEIKDEIIKYAREKKVDFIITLPNKEGDYVGPFQANSAYVNIFPKDISGFYIGFIAEKEKNNLKGIAKMLD